MATVGKALASILVIDDHVALAEGFARALTIAGYEVFVAYSADVALQQAQAHHPDAIILDFKMPFVNGVGFLYRLRELDGMERTPVLVITGESLSEETQRALQRLDATVRVKPIGIADLLHETVMLVQRRPQD